MLASCPFPETSPVVEPLPSFMGYAKDVSASADSSVSGMKGLAYRCPDVTRKLCKFPVTKCVGTVDSEVVPSCILPDGTDEILLVTVPEHSRLPLRYRRNDSPAFAPETAAT